MLSLRKYHYVYRVTRPATGEWYIGIRTCTGWPTDDTKYLGSGTRIQRVVKSGIPVDKEILAIVQTRKEAARIESALVTEGRLADPLCLNLCAGGGAGALGHRPSKETRAKMSRSHKGYKPSPETIEKVAEAHRGMKRSPETCERIGAAKRGKKLTPEHVEKVRQAKLGRKYSGEALKSMREGFAKRSQNLEWRRKLSEAAKRRWRENRQGMLDMLHKKEDGAC